jgi:hypothetical protein
MNDPQLFFALGAKKEKREMGVDRKNQAADVESLSHNYHLFHATTSQHLEKNSFVFARG